MVPLLPGAAHGAAAQARGVGHAAGGAGRLRVDAGFLAEGNKTFNLAGIQSIHVILGDGNDRLQVAKAIDLPAILSGGGGKDSLEAGGGPTVLLGGAGDDELIGGKGRDVLIGGAGGDTIHGEGKDDRLIAGVTALDANTVALRAVLDEWNSGREAK